LITVAAISRSRHTAPNISVGRGGYTSYLEAEGLRSRTTIKGNAVTAVLGELPVLVLAKPEQIQRFKAVYRHGHEIATVNRALQYPRWTAENRPLNDTAKAAISAGDRDS